MAIWTKLVDLKKVCALAEIQTRVLSNQTEDLSKWQLRPLGYLAETEERLRDVTEDNAIVLLHSQHSLGSNSGNLTKKNEFWPTSLAKLPRIWETYYVYKINIFQEFIFS